jgi:hypothetical protein
VRTQRKRLAAKKTIRNASRAKIIQTSTKAKSRTAVAKRVEETARVESSARIEPPRTGMGSRTEAPAARQESPTPQAAPPPKETHVEPAAALYQVASAGPVPLLTPPPPTSDLLTPMPTAGAGEMIRFAAPSPVPETEQLSNSAPIVAAAEVPSVEFKSDPARLFEKRVAVAERANPRKNSTSSLSWMQAVLLALGGGIITVSGFMLFSARAQPSESA